MFKSFLYWLPLIVSVLLLGIFSHSFADSTPVKAARISPKLAAEYIHAVIEANRTIYSTVIVERLGSVMDLKATENWKEENTLLLPAQFLMLSSHISNTKEVGMNYRLLSLWPIKNKNGPKTRFEKMGLEEILKNPDTPYNKIVTIKGKTYYKVIFPDRAVTKACIQCHNSHPKSPKKDFRIGDVMGGISITLPITNLGVGMDENSNLIPAKVAADYIHLILKSDRQIYSEHVVNRLQEKNIIYASENWWEENALLLPAQFLLNASDFIINKNIDLEFKLISSWPINKENGPINEFERKGLKYVESHPKSNYIWYRKIGERKYFQEIYPDFAISSACVFCHNSHPKSPKKDFKLNDVMGGIIIKFPLE